MRESENRARKQFAREQILDFAQSSAGMRRGHGLSIEEGAKS
jgi:hypothetical protein